MINWFEIRVENACLCVCVMSLFEHMVPQIRANYHPPDTRVIPIIKHTRIIKLLLIISHNYIQLSHNVLHSTYPVCHHVSLLSPHVSTSTTSYLPGMGSQVAIEIYVYELLVILRFRKNKKNIRLHQIALYIYIYLVGGLELSFFLHILGISQPQIDGLKA